MKATTLDTPRVCDVRHLKMGSVPDLYLRSRRKLRVKLPLCWERLDTNYLGVTSQKRYVEKRSDRSDR